MFSMGVGFSWYTRGIPLKLTDLYWCPWTWFIGLLLMNHHASLAMTYFLACSAVLTEFLVVVIPALILYRLSWTDPSIIFHIFSIMWVVTITASAPISSDRQGVVSFSMSTRRTNTNNIFFVKYHYTIHAEVYL